MDHGCGACCASLPNNWNVASNIHEAGHGGGGRGQGPAWNLCCRCREMRIMMILVDREPIALVPRRSGGHNLISLYRCR